MLYSIETTCMTCSILILANCTAACLYNALTIAYIIVANLHDDCIGTFDSSDLPELINFLLIGKLSNKWLDIGIQLGVDTQRLENIKQQCHNDSQVGLRDMLMLSLNQQLTWDMLANALSSPAVGGERLVLDSEGTQHIIHTYTLYMPNF